jgi:hypothetical protein
MTEKQYTSKELDDFAKANPEVSAIANNIRIEERYLANKVMGDLGIPAQQRPKIYTEAADIVTNIILSHGKEPEPAKDK